MPQLIALVLVGGVVWYAWRAFKREMAREIGMDEKHLPVFEVQMEILAAVHGKKIAEIPGDEPPRIGDVRKMRPLYNGMSILYIIFREFFRAHFLSRPKADRASGR